MARRSRGRSRLVRSGHCFLDDAAGDARTIFDPMIELNDVLVKLGLDPKRVMVMRHRPSERPLRKALRWLAAENHDLYNAYQCTHSEKVEKALGRATHLVSFIAHGAGKALFVGVYKMDGWKDITSAQYRARKEYVDLCRLGMTESTSSRTRRLFSLSRGPQLGDWIGKLVIDWPGPERSWWRWAARNRFGISAIHDENQLVNKMPPWNDLVLEWTQIETLPASWRTAIAQWRGIYVILDKACGKSYVGSAYGDDNILGRWRGYAKSGDGGNVDLKGRDPMRFQFAVLERVSPDLPAEQVIELENTWKKRLGTREFGLNKN